MPFDIFLETLSNYKISTQSPMISVHGLFLLTTKMQQAGVPTSIHYSRIMPDQPYYKEHTANPNQDLSVSRWAADHVISLPIYPDLKNETQDKIIAAVKGALNI